MKKKTKYSFKTSEKKILKNTFKCYLKCGKISGRNSPGSRKKKKRSICLRKCDRRNKTLLKRLKKKQKKEYRKYNKERQKNCCKCRYIKQNGRLYKVRGPWRHCSYDMSNCCSDKKTIVKNKNK